MNRKWCVLLIFVYILCLTAIGCVDTPADVSYSVSGNGSEEAVPGSEKDFIDEQEKADAGEPASGSVISGADTAQAAGDEVELTGHGKKRIPYTGNQSTAVYIDSPSDLPDYSELKQYDDAYFEEHALVLVTETVNSGSVDVGILAVHIQNSIATVTLYHDIPQEGEYGTADMATWLLWAEVETGMECQWIVANPALASETVAY